MTKTQPTSWPTWPFTKLTPEQMAKLMEAMKTQRLAKVEEALL